jgi:hypothetical protein
MPNWKKVITSGSDAQLNDITASNAIFNDIRIDGWGSVSASLSTTSTRNLKLFANETNIRFEAPNDWYNGTQAATLTLITGSVADGQYHIPDANAVYDYVNPISASIATDIASLSGAGYIDGNGGNEFFARFTDSNTLTGSNHLQRDIYGNIAINSRTGNWDLASFAPAAPLTVKRGTDDGAVTHNLAYLQVPNGRASSLQFANGTYSTFIGQETDGGFYIGFGNNADRTFKFINTGIVPTLSIGSLIVSGSGTLINIGPAQFSGSVSITTENQVTASVDTDKFLVLDGQQIKYRTGTQVLSDIGGLAGNGGNLTPIQLYVDCKSLTSGYAPWNVLSDLQPVSDQGYAVWIAPASGHLYETEISPEQTNTIQGVCNANLIINGGSTSQKTITLGAAGNAVNTSWGAGTYAFSKGDRLSFYFDKLTNTSDLYAIQVTFRLDN